VHEILKLMICQAEYNHGQQTHHMYLQPAVFKCCQVRNQFHCPTPVKQVFLSL